MMSGGIRGIARGLLAIVSPFAHRSTIHPGWIWRLAPEACAATVAPVLNTWVSDSAVAPGVELKRTASRSVIRRTHLGVDYYAKSVCARGVADRLRELLRGPQAAWEASRIALALDSGVPTAPVMAVGWRRCRWRRPESVLITRGLPEVVPLSQLRCTYEVPGSTLAVADRKGLIDATAALVAKLHTRDLQHGDLHAGNIVVRRDADGWQAWLIDLAALRRRWTDRSRWENLARLESSLGSTLTEADRRRFLRRYLSVTPTCSRRTAMKRCVAARQRFVTRVAPTVDAAWRHGHRKVLNTPHILALASLDEAWLTQLGSQMDDRCAATTAPMVLTCETPFGRQSLRVTQFASADAAAARSTWFAAHAALRRGVSSVVPWACLTTSRACYLVCCQPADAEPWPSSSAALPRPLRKLLPGSNFVADDVLTTPDGRWTGLANLERLVTRSTSRGRSVRAAVWLMLVLTLFGCRELNRQPTTGLPARHTVKAEQLVVQSDIRLPRNHALIKDLEQLRQEIAHTLNLPLQEQPVTIYLFADELRYAQYLQSAFPNLPPRRAYFVGTPDELAVYTYWGERIQEDLRHEYTHGVLHATLKDVPLWLDEGLAEYFEVTSQPRGMNGEYATRLADALSNGWQPDLPRLERMDSVSQMQKGDYLEAWAWVHFMLHDSDAGRDVLLTYLADLKDTAQPGPLSTRLTTALPSLDVRFRSYASTLRPGVTPATTTARGQGE